MRRAFFIFFIIAFFEGAERAYSFPFLGTRPLGFAGAFSARADDSFAIPHNPAGISLYPRYHITAFYTFSSVKDAYSTGILAVDSKTAEIGMGLSFFNWGYAPLRKKDGVFSFDADTITNNLYSLSLSENYGNYFLIGVTLNLHSMRGYENDDTFTSDIGIIIPLGNYFLVSAVGYSPLRYGRDRLKHLNDPRARNITAGGTFHYRDLFFLQLDWTRDLESTEGRRHRISVGASAKGRNFFEVRVGFARDFFTSASHIGAGFSFIGPRISFDYSYEVSRWNMNIKKEEFHSISLSLSL